MRKDTGCVFCHQHSVGRLSIFTAIKRSERCSDILHTSGARITPPPPAPPPASHENVIVTEMGAGTWLGVVAGVRVFFFFLNGVSTRFRET